jgi:23S rRNA-/tRNA-specific pseudouridylate synthase
MKDYQKSLASELLSHDIKYPEMARATGFSEGQIKAWFYRNAINEKRYQIIKDGIKKVIETRFEEAAKAKEMLNAN